jgi:DNA-binding MarR family transcriptional regulator
MADRTPKGTNIAPDFAILIVGAARVVADRLGEAVKQAGIVEMRPRYGFVIRALSESDLTLTELAQLLDVSKQAAIKVVDEMEASGFLMRLADASDRRVKALRLTEKGRAVREAALSRSHTMEEELRHELGNDVDVLRATLARFLERHGALVDAGAGRSRALW